MTQRELISAQMPSFEQRRGLVTKFLLEPITVMKHPPSHLAKNTEAQATYLGELCEQAVRLLPTDVTKDELGLILKRVKDRLLDTYRYASWPGPADLKAAIDFVLEDGPRPKRDSKGPEIDEAKLQEFLSTNDVKTLRANAKHFRRRAESSIGTDHDRRMADAMDGELDRRGEPFNTQRQNFSDMTDDQLAECKRRYDGLTGDAGQQPKDLYFGRVWRRMLAELAHDLDEEITKRKKVIA